MVGFDVRIDAPDLRTVARKLQEIGNKGLGKQMSKALQEAAKDLRPAVRDSAETLLPHRGGYATLMSKSLRFRQKIRTTATTASVVLTIWAIGPREERDVRAVNAGRLRHPVHGKRRYIKWRNVGKKRIRIPDPGQPRLNPWVQQKVKVGFVDRPVDRLQPTITKRMDAVVAYIADQIGA